jgi:FKBP-type peptidyl-prolyl cis-trans isomerase
MIPGVDEGVALLRKGAKATLYLPSPIAYGPQSPSPKIPANAIMIFEVEIKDVKSESNK